MTEHGATIVTGGSAGIGAAIVELLAERGHAVGFTYRSREPAALRICERLGVEAVRADFADPPAAAAAVHELAARFGGRVFALVNNAGINHRALLDELDLDGIGEVVNVNLVSPLLAAQAAVRHMERGGRIVNVTSILDREPIGGGASYCASKAGLKDAGQQVTLLAQSKLGPLAGGLGGLGIPGA